MPRRHSCLAFYVGSGTLSTRPRTYFSHSLSPSISCLSSESISCTFLKSYPTNRTMNQVATILGIQLPTLKARDAIKTEPLSSSSVSILPHRDSLLLLHNNWNEKQPKDLDDDADTVSTMLSSCSSLGLGVTFAEPLVTEVHLRPYTSRQEKQRLFYNESDYMEFKRDYFYGTTRDTIVRFTETVVSHVWTVPKHEEPSTMYYTETELQR